MRSTCASASPATSSWPRCPTTTRCSSAAAFSADAEAIAAGRRLLVIGRAGVGVDNIDIPAATAAGIIVVNAPTGNTVAAAEHTLALLFALARHVPAADASMHAGDWNRSAFMGRELVDKTLGIVGLGKIGMAVANRARALGMNVVGNDPFVTAEAAALHGITTMPLAEILGVADAVTVHVPKTKDTTNLISAAELATMKPEAFVINVARGGVIDEVALARGAQRGTIAGAAVDVYSSEPPAPTTRCASAPNTILTPHLGASTEEAQTRVAVEACEQVRDVLAGRPARYAVNAPLMTPETADALSPYLPLARTLGQFYAQFARGVSGLTLEVGGRACRVRLPPPRGGRARRASSRPIPRSASTSSTRRPWPRPAASTSPSTRCPRQAATRRC